MEPGDDGTLAGWHRDPSGRHELRFWDGTRWTEHIIDEGIPALDHPTRSGQAPGTTTRTPAPPAATGPQPLTVEPPGVVEHVDVVEAVLEPPVAPEAVAPEAVAPEAVAPEAVAAEAVAPEAVVVSDPETIDLAGAEFEAGELATSADDEQVEPTTEADATTEPEVASVSATRDTGPGHSRTGRTPREPRVRHTPPSTSTPKAAPATPPTPPPSRTEPAPQPQRPEPTRVIAEPPTVASPAGNSAGANTSAIADPHRALTPNLGTDQGTSQGRAPRVARATTAPVKRFRPGSPPPSPFAGPRALPAAGGVTIGTVVTPWYRKASWIAALSVVAVGAVVAIIALSNTGGTPSGRLGARPPGAAPQGSKVIDGEGFGIAVPSIWIVATDPGGAFPQLAHTNWRTPLAATDIANGEAIVVVALHDLAHQSQVDPELFWSDQVRGAGSTRSVTPGRTLSVHGFRANQVTVTDPSGSALVAASIDTGDATYLVAVTARTVTAASARFERLIQTFDAR